MTTGIDKNNSRVSPEISIGQGVLVQRFGQTILGEVIRTPEDTESKECDGRPLLPAFAIRQFGHPDTGAIGPTHIIPEVEILQEGTTLVPIENGV